MKTFVLGLGVSGKAAAQFLLRQKREVIGCDAKLEGVEHLREQGMTTCLDTEKVDWEEIEQCVVSPGISPKHPLYAQALERGVPIMGELELGLSHLKAPLLGITGTNGKTTVTLLVEHILNANGIRAKALGNVGTSVCAYLNEALETHDAYVIELSSYQLETLSLKVFDTAVLLNITPDHLDRYETMREYAQAKCKLAHSLKEPGKLFVYERVLAEWEDLLAPERIGVFGWGDGLDFWTDGKRFFGKNSNEYLLPLSYREKGEHEIENTLAAWILSRSFSITDEGFSAALETFQTPAHRIEFVKKVRGVSYFDDSKGTNIDAVIRAVQAMRGQVILIAGGVDKGASYLLWREHFAGKVKSIVAIGQAAPKIASELSPYFEIKRADSLSSSVQIASALAAEGDSVLLSPGCSSFDMFCDYAHRGREFQKLVYGIEEES